MAYDFSVGFGTSSTVVLAFLLMACQEDREIQVHRVAPDRVEFAVEGGGGRSDSCIYFLEVRDPARPDDAVWGLDLEERDKCTNRVVAGEAPPGYSVIPGSRSMQAGDTYEVYVSGPGYQSTATFQF